MTVAQWIATLLGDAALMATYAAGVTPGSREAHIVALGLRIVAQSTAAFEAAAREGVDLEKLRVPSFDDLVKDKLERA